MTKLFLTIALAFSTMIASAQFSALTTISEATDSTWSVTDKLGVGYQLNEKLIVGLTKDGEEDYEVFGRYIIKNGLWGTCIYNYSKDSEDDMTDRLDLGVGYSVKVWKNLYADPNYTMSMKEDENGEREGSFNLSFSYKF